MKKYTKIICMIAAVCLLGAAAFCGFRIYSHYAHESKQEEVFEKIAKVVEQAQTGESETADVLLTEEETVLMEYGELYLQNTDMVGWLSIAGTNINYPVMQTPNNPNYYLKHNFEKEYSDLGSPTVIIAPITSRIHTKAKLPTHTLIKDFDGLDKNSIILFEQIRTIDKQRLREYLGTLDRRFIHYADKALAISIGLAKKD